MALSEYLLGGLLWLALLGASIVLLVLALRAGREPR